MIAYFANHRQSILGALNRCFEQWAGLNGVNCMQCVQLALLFSLGVDSVKSGMLASWPLLYCTGCIRHFAPNPTVQHEHQGVSDLHGQTAVFDLLIFHLLHRLQVLSPLPYNVEGDSHIILHL